MVEPVLLADMKKQLKAEDVVGEDDYITGLIIAARRSCEKKINRSVADLTDAGDLSIMAHAIMMLVAGWYRNREPISTGTGSAPAEMPLAVTWLLNALWSPPA